MWSARGSSGEGEFMRNSRLLVLVLWCASLFCGCQSGPFQREHSEISPSFRSQIYGFRHADAKAVVSQRIITGNWQFLGYSGGMLEESFIPGLTQEEVERYIDSGLFSWECFFYYHLYFHAGSPAEENELAAARLDYAERVNRELLRRIGQRTDSELKQAAVRAREKSH